MIARLGLLLVVAIAASSCSDPPTDEELTAMCKRLAELRGEEPDAAAAKQCVAAARAEGVSRRQALCRIQAINTQEYWNRCRTGAPRE